MKTRKVFKNSFYALLFVVLGVVGCKTTPPTLGYIKPSKEAVEAHGNREMWPHDGVYIDFGKNGSHTHKMAVMIYDLNGNLVYKGENFGVDALGRILSNAGAFIGAGTLFASPFWGFLAAKEIEGNRINISGGGGGSSSSSSTATSSSGP